MPTTARKSSPRKRKPPAREGQKITICLTFNNQAEEAVKFYTSVFKNSKITSQHWYEEGPMKGDMLFASFEIEGQGFTALNGGPHFAFAPGISLFVNCATQKEVDHLWEKLSKGGQKQPCGWLQDRFGVSWQIVPVQLGQMLMDPERGNSAAVMEAMLQMSKLDIRGLVKAYKQR